MNAISLVNKLKELGVTISLNAEQNLIVKSFGSKLDGTLRELITSHKSSLIDYLSESEISSEGMDMSLFFFAEDQNWSEINKYNLYLESAKRADKLGLAAIWTPERHFNRVAGLYPNPSVLSSALAMITSKVKLRAGSVVLPLQNPIRVAEEWSMVDNLSNGRIGLAFASGWVPNDFVFSPNSYENRKDIMLENIEKVRQLWRGEPIHEENGIGKQTPVYVYPRPIQEEPPIWLSCAANPETFRIAGQKGFNIITALLMQSLDEAGEKVAIYKDALLKNGHDPATKNISIMLHTFLDEDEDYAIETAREPFCRYMKSHVKLISTVLDSHDAPKIDLNQEKDLDSLAKFAYQRYLKKSSLIGSPKTCLPMLEKVKALGFNEVACLIDFGVEADKVIRNIDYIKQLSLLGKPLQVDRKSPAINA